MQVFQSYCTHVFCNIFIFSLLNPCYVNTLSLETQFSFTAAALKNFVVLKTFLFKPLLGCFGLNSKWRVQFISCMSCSFPSISFFFFFWALRRIFIFFLSPIISLFIMTQKNGLQEWNHFFNVLQCKIKFRVLWEHIFYYYRHTISIIWMNMIYNKQF